MTRTRYRVFAILLSLGAVSIVWPYLRWGFPNTDRRINLKFQQYRDSLASFLNWTDPGGAPGTFSAWTGATQPSAASDNAPSSSGNATIWQPADYASEANVQCTKLLSGDKQEVMKAKAFVTANYKKLRRLTDAADWQLVNVSCKDLLDSGYSKISSSQIEVDFPLAFGIRFHQRPSQMERLLRFIYAPHNIYCLHVDPTASEVVQSATRRIAFCLSNVHVVTPTEKTFVYGSVSPLLADVACMRLALAANATRWRYFINLTGQELPLRTNDELVRLLMLYNGSNEIASQQEISTEWRYASSQWCKDDTGDRSVRCAPPLTPKSAVPGNVTVYKGLAYGFFSRAFVEYSLAEGGFGMELMEWFNDTYSPDENYWATLNRLPGVPGGYTGPEKLVPTARAVLWARVGGCQGKYVHEICIFSAADLPWLLTRHEAFANKFQVDYDPIAWQCLAQHVFARGEGQRLWHDALAVPWYRSLYLTLPQIQAMRNKYGA